MMISRLIQTALITISSGACLTQAPTFNNEIEPNNAIVTETTTVTIDEYRIKENYYGQEIWEYNSSTWNPEGTQYYDPGGTGIAVKMEQYRLIYEVPDNYGSIVINSYRYMLPGEDADVVRMRNVANGGYLTFALDIIEINAAESWEEIKPRNYIESTTELYEGKNVNRTPQLIMKYQDQTRPRTIFSTPDDIENEYRDITFQLPTDNNINANVYVEAPNEGLDGESNYEPNKDLISYINEEPGNIDWTTEIIANLETREGTYIKRGSNENKNYCALSILTGFRYFSGPPATNTYTESTFGSYYTCSYEITLTKKVNTNPTTPEIVDLPGVMYTVLSMPFSFISQAFNLTLFAGTPYAVNIADIFLGILTFMILIFLIRLIIRNQA